MSNYTCSPITFGYSIAEGSKVFPDFTYPSCSSVTETSKSLLQINRKKNLLTMNCPKGKNSFYFSGPYGNKNFNLKSSVKKFAIHKYTKPVNAEEISFGLGLCTNKASIGKTSKNKGRFINYDIDPEELQHADMKPLFDEKLLSESILKMIELKSTKPKLIFLLTLDSISRRHFYRKLPKLVKYLNESESQIPHISVYDFKMHSTYGSDSVHNQVPIFGGADAFNILKKKTSGDRLGKMSMWSQMKEKGFVTVMGFDDCDHWFPEYLGENLNVDYMIRQFYCLVDVYGQVKTEKKDTEQRCLGPHQTHTYMLNYTMSLIEMYKQANMWIYLHVNAGHERTGQHASTADEDLVQFLKRLFDTTAGTTEVFLLLHADHGMRYGDWYGSIEAFQETTLPSLFLLSDKSLLEKYENSFHCLEENSKRLTSKLDLRKTILSLIDENDFYDWGSINLLKEIASYTRNCEDLNSDPLFCACSKTKILDLNERLVSKLVKIFKEQAEERINKISFNHPEFDEGLFCDQVILDKVVSAFHLANGPNKELFRIQFGSSFFSRLKLQIDVRVSMKVSEFSEKEIKFKTFKFVVNGRNYIGAVWFI